jgi:glycosyltransferase involved in cell wall biosynthesis
MRLNYICIWHKHKEKTWSGTTYALYQACRTYFDVTDRGIRFSKVENLFIRLWGIFTHSHEFNLIRDFFTWVRVKHKLHANPGIQLQIGDIVIPDHTSYIYQDNNVSYLKFLMKNDPIAFSYSGYSHVSEKVFDSRIERQKKVYNNSAGIFTMSQWLADYIVSNMGIPADKVHHVGGGINVNPNMIDPAKKTGNKILFVGRDFKRKAGPLVVDAFKILVAKHQPDAELYIIGPSENPVKGSLSNIHFVGEASNKELSYYFNICDIFCMPSHFEAYGLVFIEALTYGLPCIGRNKFAMKEFIQHGKSGYLIENDDADMLALMMHELLKNDQIKRNVEMNRDQYIIDYSWDAVSKRVADIIMADNNESI